MAAVIVERAAPASRRAQAVEDRPGVVAPSADADPSAKELARVLAGSAADAVEEANPFRVLARRPAERVASYGPGAGRIDDLLLRAAALSRGDIEDLAAVSGRHCRQARYVESLLALRRAAEQSGRSAAVGRAGDAAEQLVAEIAASRCPPSLDDRACWNVVAERAAWAAGDAARALVVSDLLPEPHLRTLTLAWNGLTRGR